MVATPEPGIIPVLDSWIVRHNRSREREANASTAMTQEGFNCWDRAAATRPLSIPVEASTPGATGGHRTQMAKVVCRLFHQVAGD